MPEIKLICPDCGKHGFIVVKDNLILKNDSGIAAVNVTADIICDHSFVAYVDRNMAVRDTFTCDFKVEIPSIDFKERKTSQFRKEFSVDMIKLNIIPSLFINVLKGIFFGKNVVIIYDEEFIGTQFVEFYNYLTEDNFKSNVAVISRKDYQKSKKKYKNHMVLDNIKVIHDKDKISNIKSKIPNVITQKFYLEFDSEMCLIMLKNEIYKAFTLTREIMKFIKELNSDEKIDIIRIINHIENVYKVKIGTLFLNFLLDIIKINFKFNVPLIYKNILGFL